MTGTVDLTTMIAELERLRIIWLESDSEDASIDFAEACGNSLPTLIEALKRQGEALNHIVSIGEGHGSNYDFERILDMRDIARAALKEATDV